MASVGVGGEDFHCCNGICLTVPTNPNPGTFYYPFGAFGNKVNFIIQYEAENRQKCSVYFPANVSVNSVIVVVIQGDDWFSVQQSSI